MPSEACPLCGGTDSCERVHAEIASRFHAGDSILSLRDEYGIANERNVVLILVSEARKEGHGEACAKIIEHYLGSDDEWPASLKHFVRSLSARGPETKEGR
jgi:hypothetical protein